MSTRRACHALAVLDGKLYVIHLVFFDCVSNITMPPKGIEGAGDGCYTCIIVYLNSGIYF